MLSWLVMISSQTNHQLPCGSGIKSFVEPVDPNQSFKLQVTDKTGFKTEIVLCGLHNSCFAAMRIAYLAAVDGR